MTPTFTSAWLEGGSSARRLLPASPWTAERRREAVEAAEAWAAPTDVVEALADVASRLAPSEARTRHLEALSRPGTVVVATGQQAGLFMGPLYTFYKAASAIRTARALAEETGREVVPVLWAATEDHDAAEASTCGVPSEGAEPLELSVGPCDERPIPVAYRRLGAAVEEALRRLDEAVSELPNAEAVGALLRRHYGPEATFAEAFAGLAGELFAEEGLLIADPRHPRFLHAAAGTQRWAFDEATPIAEALGGRAERLRAEGFDVPVHVRPGAPLPFVHPEGSDGPRHRVEPAGEGWHLVGRDERVPDAQLRRWLEAEPERFSSSALLRPLVQDTLLPVAAHVVGPGELAYLAQTPPLYEARGRPLPLVVPRNRFRVVGPRERRLGERLGLAPDEAARPRDELLKALGAGAQRAGEPDPDAIRQRALDPVARELEALRETASGLDPALAKRARRTEQAIEDRVDKLVDRYRQALAARDETTTRRLDRFLGVLAPSGGPQERVLGLPWFAARHGVDAFRRLVAEACEPFPSEPRDLEP